MKFEIAKNLNGYGVAVMDTQRDYLIRHFDGFSKSDAKEIVRFCNIVIGNIEEQMSDNNCARVIQVGNGFYVTKVFKLVKGETVSFSSHDFKNEITACRCAAILETALNEQNYSDGDCDENS